jgi:hypothetical protein
MFLAGGLVQIFVFIGFLFLKDLYSQYMMVFLLGLSQPVKSMIAYTHLMEFLPDRESNVSGLFMCLDGMIYMVSPLIF